MRDEEDLIPLSRLAELSTNLILEQNQENCVNFCYETFNNLPL